jgi:hypothetical protein
MRQRTLALCGLVALVFLAGCSFGGGEIPEDELTGEAEYDWDTNASASFTLHDSERFSFSSETYAAVIRIDNRSSLGVYRETALQGDSSIQIEALQFRFTNGTVVNATHSNLTAIERSGETEIRFPADNGTVGYTTVRDGKRWSTPAFVDGAHEVTLPAGGRVGIPLLSRTIPGGYETSVTDDRMTIRWAEVDRDQLLVRFYLVRDLYLLGAVVAVAGVVGTVGLLYYLRAIRDARKKREEVGLDVDMEDDDFGDDPPPGMR